MSISRWEPFGEFRHFREMMDRILEEPFYISRMVEGVRILPIDMYETPDQIVIKTTVAGMKPEDVDISVSGNILTIRAERKEEAEQKGRGALKRERFYGRYERSITLPTQVLANKAKATFENGELTLQLPKAEEAKSKHIKIQTITM